MQSAEPDVDLCCAGRAEEKQQDLAAELLNQETQGGAPHASSASADPDLLPLQDQSAPSEPVAPRERLDHLCSRVRVAHSEHSSGLQRLLDEFQAQRSKLQVWRQLAFCVTVRWTLDWRVLCCVALRCVAVRAWRRGQARKKEAVEARKQLAQQQPQLHATLRKLNQQQAQAAEREQFEEAEKLEGEVQRVQHPPDMMMMIRTSMSRR